MVRQRINLWSSPRNISTALMYSFAQRPDTTVVDEPLYAYYLRNTPSASPHPGTEEVLATLDNDGERVVQNELLYGEYPTPVVLFKQMTHHLLDLDRAFLTRMDNVLLIRDPRAILASYGQVVEKATLFDVGILQQHELYCQLREAGRLAAVVDARLLLLDPAGVLRQLCERLGLPFTEAMLRWPPGPRPEDGVWAKYWYHNVHNSSGFQPYREREYELPPRLAELAEQARPYYTALRGEALRGSG